MKAKRAVLLVGAAATIALALSFGCSLIVGDKTLVLAGADGSAIDAPSADGRTEEASTDAGTADGGNYELDPSFGEGGVVTFSPAGVAGEALAAAIDGSGRVVVAGWAQTTASASSFAVARVLASGALDTTFGASGVARTDVLVSSIARAVAIQADGRIVAAGSTLNADGRTHVTIVRYTAQGQGDPSFGDAGARFFPAGGDSEETATGVVVDGAGNVTVGGSAYHNGGAHEHRVLVGALPPNGTPPTFITYGAKNVDEGRGLVATNGGFLVPGASNVDTDPRMQIFRASGAGTFDPNFDASANLSPGADLAASAALTTGGFVAGGTARADSGAADFAIAAFATSGAPDPAFGDAGVAFVDFGGSRDEARAMALDATARVWLAGECDAQACVARVSAVGSVQLTRRIPIGARSGCNAIAIAPDGSVYLAGSTGPASSPAMFVAKLRP